MKMLTGLIVVLSLAASPLHAKVITITNIYEKLNMLFSQACPNQMPSSGLSEFKSELDRCYDEKAIPEPQELKLEGVALGLEGDYPDDRIFASSYLDDNTYPARGRLNAAKKGLLRGAWCSEVNNDMQFFQVDLGAVSILTGIKTQGEYDSLNWVELFTLEISMDGHHWGCVFGSDGRVKIFEGNSNGDTVKVNVMHPFIETRYVRIIPKKWTGHICMRVEIYVEEIMPWEDIDPTPVKDFETQTLEVNPKPPKPLVIKNGRTNQVDTGVVPAIYTDEQVAPLQSINFEHPKLHPDLYQVPGKKEDFETELLEVNPKPPKPLVIKNGRGNQVDTGVVPAIYTDEQVAPLQSINFEHPKLHPDLYQVQEAGRVGKPLEPDQKLQPLDIFGGGPVVDRTIAPGFYSIPVEVGTFKGNPPEATLEFSWYPARYEINMYLEFAFSYPVHIRGFSTKGNPTEKQWVSFYKVEYLDRNLMKWVWLKGEDKEDIIIEGNSDGFTTRHHIYEPYIFTSRIRMYVLNYSDRPYMAVQLFLEADPREAPQVVTGPIYKDGLCWWAWEEQTPKKGYTEEVYFEKDLTLLAFEFTAESTIKEYELQYLTVNKEWASIFGDETSILSNGDAPDVKGKVAKGMRIIIISWTGDRMYAEVNLEVDTDKADIITITDIIELSSNYILYKWQDSNPTPGSAVVFNFGEKHRVTRIETKGIDGAWVSSYHLECRSKFSKDGIFMALDGNSNDKEIVEHIFTEPNLSCKYILITPDTTDGIGMEIYIYTEKEVKAKGSSAKVLNPGSKGGRVSGQWAPGKFGEKPYVQLDFDHNITPTRITLKRFMESGVKSFTLAKSSDGETFGPILDDNNEVKKFPLGKTDFGTGKFNRFRYLRIFPEVPKQGGIGFEWKFSFKSEKTVSASANVFPGDNESDTGGGEQ